LHAATVALRIARDIALGYRVGFEPGLAPRPSPIQTRRNETTRRDPLELDREERL
jgi:hypothetical protein